MLIIDVEKLLQTPLATEQQLQAKLAAGGADRPLAVPATARRLAISAAMHPTGMDAMWQAAVIDVDTRD